MKLIESLEHLQSLKDFREFTKESLLLVTNDDVCYVSKDKIDFDEEGKTWRGHAFLAGKKGVLAMKKLKSKGVIFREARCQKNGKNLTIGDIKPPKLHKEAERLFLKLKLGYKLSQQVGTASTIEASSSVVEGDMTLIKQVPLGNVVYDGKRQGKLWAVTDPQNNIVTSGASPSEKDMAHANKLGRSALKAITDLESLDLEWRRLYKNNIKASAQAKEDVKKLVESVPAMKKRNAKGNSRDDNFDLRVKVYLDALDEAQTLVEQTEEDGQALGNATNKLTAAVLELRFDEAEKMFAIKEDMRDQLRADMAESKRIFGDLLSTAIQFAKQDWKGLATRAVTYLGEKSIEAEYAPGLEKLSQELIAAKNAMTKLKTDKLVTLVEAARHELNRAALALASTEKQFVRTLEKLDRERASARNELNESPSTKHAATMIEQRVQHIKDVDKARATCAKYLRDSAKIAKAMAGISRNYILVSDMLDAAGKANPAFADSMYKDIVLRGTTSNAVELDRWTNWASSVQVKCTKAHKWLNTKGPGGPMGSFDKVIPLISNGLK